VSWHTQVRLFQRRKRRITRIRRGRRSRKEEG
jgi:hypothetical protein